MFLILQGLALSLRGNYKIIFLSNVGTVKTTGTLGDGLNIVFIIRWK
jgi:hypothetical protein